MPTRPVRPHQRTEPPTSWRHGSVNIWLGSHTSQVHGIPALASLRMPRLRLLLLRRRQHPKQRRTQKRGAKQNVLGITMIGGNHPTPGQVLWPILARTPPNLLATPACQDRPPPRPFQAVTNQGSSNRHRSPPPPPATSPNSCSLDEYSRDHSRGPCVPGHRN